MMRHGLIFSSRGITLIELLISVAIFSVVAIALAQTLITAQRARWTSANWMQAAQLAIERLERLRAGDRSDRTESLGKFERACQSQVVAGYRNLERVDVTVSWQDRGLKQFTLSAFVRDN